jgi:hypothetical protein
VNIISFALFGANPAYREGFLQNVDAAHRVFPGWHVLVYCDRVNFDALNALALPNTTVILQGEHSEGVEGMIWRFLASTHPSAEAVIFRDTDSILTRREKRAVDEWLASDRDVHLIRDHPLHISPVMGGMFGVRGQPRTLLASLIQQGLETGKLVNYGDDQRFLSSQFYPRIKRQALVHTSLIKYVFEYAAPLPPEAADESFIGAYFSNRSDEENKRLEKLKAQARPMTLMPYSWERKPILKVLFKRFRIKGITYRCDTCL